ncbi:protein ENHANCED PSEUDOMONAS SUSCEPTIBILTY 1-like [Neltuma alba]|uniref:protein ENHANCED PSEUDOMONAS SUSCEPTIBILTY 1-like n=1 Tax=Neltuma alba TaxID=207710 RepID=UPI0010A37223|nr:protein ENHANCED PSEUDOMONAS SUSCEPTIBILTY 1-like [Prosopis alba]
MHPMEAVRTICTTTIRARRGLNHGDSPQQIDLNPWDLQFLLLEYAQKGLLFHKPASLSSSILVETVIQQLKDSLSSTLDFFLPLAGRLLVVPHGGDDDTSSVFITCNNAGVSFVHAIAENTKIAAILEPTYVPTIVSSFFPPGNIENFEADRVPLLAVQVTELVDGIFIACSINHCLADVKPYWNFLNAWAQISRNGLNHVAPDSKLASFERWFPHGNIERPITIPFRKVLQHHLKESTGSIQSPPFSGRIFHLQKEKIAQLRAKANSEVQDSIISNKISSLQAVLGHVWRSVIRNQNLDPEEEVTYRFLISARSKVSHPPIPDDYFGVTVQFTAVTMKVRDLAGDGGFGKFVWEMNKEISSCTEEKIKSDFEAWIRNPAMRTQRATIGKFMTTSSSPRTNFYEIDFGWGRPVAVRGGGANAKQWKIAVDAGAEEGSFDVELWASYQILEALARDREFMEAVELPLPAELTPSGKVARTRL